MPPIEVLQQQKPKPDQSKKMPAAKIGTKMTTGDDNNNNNNNIRTIAKGKPTANISEVNLLTDSETRIATAATGGLFPGEEHKLNKLEALRNLVENHDDFVRRSDDLFLSRFLICCDWNVDDAYQRMCKLFKLKREYPDWFTHKPLADYEPILKRNIKFVLDKRDKNGRRVFVSRMGNLDINISSATDLAHLDELWVEFMLNEIDTLEKGVSCLIDMSGYSLKSLRYLTPSNIRIGTQKADLLPLKHMEFHVVNSSAFLNAALAILYPMLSKQIKEQVHFHYSNWDSLHSALGKECLPAEYGGTNGATFDFEKLNRQLLDLEVHYDGLLKYGYELKPHVDPAKHAAFYQNLEKIKTSRRKTKCKKQDEVVEE
ncbi:alpha-tocopherol transfer protein-like [Uranotaenia lowii]|uniref:alpha-tocopherol transfer protein-like n=1 Tax=Uranotaenia lowii TaxID=190385 RepID=UPI0024799871|nr:alpha-tocopherol transfer protein-like [Uranotaenia lowii]